MKRTFTAAIVALFVFAASAKAHDVQETVQFQDYKTYVTSTLFELSLTGTLSEEEADEMFNTLDGLVIAAEDAAEDIAEQAETELWADYSSVFDRARIQARRKSAANRKRAVNVFRRSTAAINRKFKRKTRAAVRQRKRALTRAKRKRANQIQAATRRLRSTLIQINRNAEGGWKESSQFDELTRIVESNRSALDILDQWAETALGRIVIEAG